MNDGKFEMYVGLKFRSVNTHTPTEDDIVEFGKKYDPYPFHTDREAAKTTFFGELIAPGVMTDSILIKLAHNLMPRCPVDSIFGMIGAESVQYIKPVRPGEALSADGVVVYLEQSRSNPSQGVMKVQWELKTSKGVVVFNRTNILLVNSKYCRW